VTYLLFLKRTTLVYFSAEKIAPPFLYMQWHSHTKVVYYLYEDLSIYTEKLTTQSREMVPLRCWSLWDRENLPANWCQYKDGNVSTVCCYPGGGEYMLVTLHMSWPVRALVRAQG